jgi:PAS domain S-box-containing protein
MSDGNRPPLEQTITELNRLANSILQRIRQQRDVLRQHGMDVPPGTIKNLEGIQAELEQASNRIVEQHNEVDRLRALVDTTAMINASLNLEQTLGAVIQTVIRLTRAERAYIMLHDPATGRLSVKAGRDIHQSDPNATPMISHTIIEQVFNNKQPIVTTDALSDLQLGNQASVVGLSLRSVLCVPLVIKNHVAGVVYADSSMQTGLFGNKELQLLVAVASQSALAIENARLFEQTRATLAEITEVKTLLDNILASIVSGVITTDAEDVVTTYNAGAANILGLERESSQGKPIQEAAPQVYDLFKDQWQQVRQKDELVTLDTETTLNNGVTKNLSLKLSPLKDATQTTQGVALVLDDQTELKQRDAMLQAVRRYLPPAMVDNIRDIQNIGLGGERRNVTILFVEVLPFAAFQGRLKADELMELLNVYLTVGTECIHRHAGLIDKYMGSEIMAIFNTQLNPSENHAWDAIQTALDLTHSFQELHQNIGENPSIRYYRVGIHTGDATLGNVGSSRRREFTAIGDTVNLAKRLEENAQAGQIFISQETYLACQAQFAQQPQLKASPRGTLHVKGREQAVQVLEINPPTL